MTKTKKLSQNMSNTVPIGCSLALQLEFQVPTVLSAHCVHRHRKHAMSFECTTDEAPCSTGQWCIQPKIY